MKTHTGKVTSVGHKIVYGLLLTIFSLYALSLILPFVWAVLVSLKTQQEYMYNSPFAFPETWKVANYVTAFQVLKVGNTGLLGMLVNSLWYAAGMTIGNVFVCSMTAYIFARYPFKGSRQIYNVLLFVMLVPIIGSGPSQYKLFGKLQLLNSPLFVISNAGGIGTNFLFLEAFYRNVSWEYAEAAFVDGASATQVYFKIMFPQAIGMIATLAIMQFIGYWNDYSTPLVMFKNLPNLALGLYLYEMKMIRGANMPVYFAGLVISIVPVLTIFAFCQNSIMEKVALGGLKG